jgi:uncharacterized phage protein gp47/JayE
VSNLLFDPDVGVVAPQTVDIRDRIAQIWRDAFQTEGLPALDTEPTSPAGQLIDALVAEVEAKNAELLYLANQFNPKVAEGRWQDALGHIYFMTRKAAEPTIVVCELTGLAGTVIPYGVMVEDGEGRRFVCNKSVALDDAGLGETTFRSVAFGPVEVGPGSVRKIVTAVAGWDTVNNPAAGTAGRYLESRFDYEARRAESVAKNAHGTAASIYGSLHDLSGVAGVIDVKVLENIGPDPVIKSGVVVPGHGVTICIFGGDDDDIARIIYEKKDAGCDTGGNTVVTHTPETPRGLSYQYLIMRPESVQFWVKVTLGDSEVLTTDLEARIKAAVVGDFNGTNVETGNPRAGLAQTIYASRFYCAVLAAGTRNLYGIEVALGDTPAYGPVVEILGDQEPAISADNVTVEVQA